MTIAIRSLLDLNKHWAVDAIRSDKRERAFSAANAWLVRKAAGKQLHLSYVDSPDDLDLIERTALAYEVAALEGVRFLLYPGADELTSQLREQAQAGAFQCFQLSQVLPIPEQREKSIFHVLHLAGVAYAGDRWNDLRRWIQDQGDNISAPSAATAEWDKRLLFRLYDCWLRLLRKKHWDDLDSVREIVAGLREDQKTFEADLLKKDKPEDSSALAIRLVSLYHLAKGTELLAIYMLQGEPAGIAAEIDRHFEAAGKAALRAQDPPLQVLITWLHLSARRMVAGSLWWVARAVNSRVTRYVQSITRAQGLFELLPPQRAALLEQGLLDSASRAVVVDLPTSGGKTVLAEFRVLQALNQFDADKGWVAYVAPTRALVAQITRRLRKDFGPIGINVEQLSSAIEIDVFENAIFCEQDQNRFHVLVATPEKLQLVIRSKSISRPLALIVMDEAHNIEDEERGLRIELLLATIKRDCPTANFLLLMPNVPNAADLTNWLAPEMGKTISIGSSAWQPNERIVGIFYSQKDGKLPREWSLKYEALTTPHKTMQLHGVHNVGTRAPLNLPFGKMKSLSMNTLAMSKVFCERGTSIAVARTIPDAWRMARQAAPELQLIDPLPQEISLVQRFLQTEVSPQFELIEMLKHGVGVHHAGLSEETRALIEWLAEIGKLKILCATTGIAQGLNFPVSSVFLASPQLPIQGSRQMSPRAFWNLAGRAGRIGHDTVGVVGLAAGDKPQEMRAYVSQVTGDLVSRLVTMLEELQSKGDLAKLVSVFQQDQWSDFRIFVAHLLNEKKNLDAVIAEAESLLRTTLGYGTLKIREDHEKSNALLNATKQYARAIAEHPENAVLADATGFSPEGVSRALLGLNSLEKKLTIADWQPQSIFGESSSLPQIIGVMLTIPEVRGPLVELGAHGPDKARIAQIASDWVNGKSIEDIARSYFSGDDQNPKSLTDALTDACKGIYKALAYGGTWGISALSKMPTSGILFDELSEDQRRQLNALPAMLYHGVNSAEAIVMRMNCVPRTISEALGKMYIASFAPDGALSATGARNFLRSLTESDWNSARPSNGTMSGTDYQMVWSTLSGESSSTT
jgi:superfamily II DNA/RNA helicase